MSPEPRSAPQGFSRERRVRARRDFQATYAESRKYVGRYFVVFARSGGDLRLGITATRKVGGAVARNRVRRRVREVFRRYPFPEGASGDIVVNVRDGAPGAPFANLAAELEGLLRRAVRGAAA